MRIPYLKLYFWGETVRTYSKSSKMHQHPVSAESHYARSLGAGWLYRLLQHNIAIDADFLACLSWSLNSLRPLVQHLRREIEQTLPKDLREPALRLRAEKSPAHAGKNTDKEGPLPPKYRKNTPAIYLEQYNEALNDLRQLTKFADNAIHRKLGDMLADNAAVLLEPFSEAALEYCRKASAIKSVPKSFCNAERHLSHLFGLDETSIKICVFTFMANAFGPVESYFSDSIGADRFNGRRLLAQMMDISPGQCRKVISELRRLGILDSDSHYMRMQDKIYDLWDESNPDKAAQMFCRPLSGETLPLGAFPIAYEDAEHVLALLKPRKGTDADKPVHILLYGPPGTGKTTFARSLAQHLGLKAWAVPSRFDDEDVGRRASLNACIHLAGRHQGAFVLADEAERLLDSSIYSSRKSHDKAWINELMEQPGHRIIWVTNQVEHIEQAVRRRFTYSIHFEEPSLAQRKALWKQILERNGVSGKIDAGSMQLLLKNYTPPAAIINEAVRQSKIVAGRKGGKAFARSVLRIVEAHDTLRRDGKKQRRKKNSVSGFTLDGISLRGGKTNARHELDALLAKLKKADALLRQGQEPSPGMACTLLFYGPPGTGKSALARYLAEEMDRDCIVKKASDLLSPYVGESEQNIAAAFREAERDGAVLLVDEADSFIFSRDGAVRSWESSMVNEFLTALEDYRGFCICTTNRRKDIDNAAMRRFAFKVGFDYSGPEQLASLYNALLAPLAGSELPDEQRNALLQIKNLTPGDFHAVQTRLSLEKQESVTHTQMLNELKQELSAKLEKISRNIGF